MKFKINIQDMTKIQIRKLSEVLRIKPKVKSVTHKDVTMVIETAKLNTQEIFVLGSSVEFYKSECKTHY